MIELIEGSRTVSDDVDTSCGDMALTSIAKTTTILDNLAPQISSPPFALPAPTENEFSDADSRYDDKLSSPKPPTPPVTAKDRQASRIDIAEARAHIIDFHHFACIRHYNVLGRSNACYEQ
jgi:hypothetical protein